MTRQQIRELYPQAQAVQLNPNIKVEEAARLRVDEFQLDDRPFALQFFFDSAGGLYRVELRQGSDNNTHCIFTFDRFEELLNQKYGKSSVRTEQKEEGQHVVWNTRNMIVSLTYFPRVGAEECDVFILISNLSPTFSITYDATATPCRGLSLSR